MFGFKVGLGLFVLGTKVGFGLGVIFGLGFGVGLGVGALVPVIDPVIPIGLGLGLVLHCGILQQVGSLGSGTMMQLGAMLEYVGHLKCTDNIINEISYAY